MKFVLFHGSFGNPEENWFPQLKEQLQLLDQEVVVPTFPCDDWDELTKAGLSAPPKHQSLENWFKAFDEMYKTFDKNEKLCFIGHSLGPLFILHVVERYNIQLDSAIFISPFMSKLNKPWQFDHVNAPFYKTDFDYEKLRKRIPVSYVLYSDSDPYVEREQPVKFAEPLHSSIILVKKAGHLNAAVNLNEFPLVYELCKSRLDLSLYQHYIDHRRQLFATNYLKGRHEEVVYLKPEEIFDEGLFHFRNLSKKGFCTFFTGLSLWETQSEYYKEARKAALRVKDFTRVFVVQDLDDLKRTILLQQIDLDLKAGIKIFLVMMQDIEKEVRELDFGIWDNDYLCVVRFNKEKQVEVKLSSRKQDILEAEKWEKIILAKAEKITGIDNDINTFIKKHS
ncbi:MAG TPA: alpha/beta hydrolase [Patescibacteria group bacterium]|nr:alpha/beta hydrolase [Patescibacteria group bacterium]